MKMLEMIVLLSMVMWYIIDRAKPMWESLKNGKYITMVVSAVFAGMLAAGYHLNIIAALGVETGPEWLGMVLTALLLMGGSSAVSELITRVKG